LRGDASDSLTIWYMTYDHGASSDHTSFANANARNDAGADADQRAVADRDVPSKMYPWTNMNTVTNHAVMIDGGIGVNDNACT
jgi:hypothetical protein